MGKSKCKKLKYGPREYLDQLDKMFHYVVVDGSTSYMTGQEDEGDGEDVEQYGDLEFLDHIPMNANSRKRSSSTSCRSTATSLGKRYKILMVRMMRELVTKWSTSEDATQEVLKKAAIEKGETRWCQSNNMY
ncbi:hypothetical protein GUJ93_ZPchr0013g37553 [Zizania palustris]|uniref:Uncharacterized protein n=1 Tax=Zizania palustris TaxID=103762 RepID=A0A8J6BXU1_ZIZPA|nr:hypothetical protein GUJ93_ZPchr0013g37553 [Zizania palustris]